ncbi:hypothetical protein TRFO_13346 [Tritrichomonas foetus]|uniref:Thioredoxin domain-containing protein n=1 Tax=Tritrichomonas foetus TaxID=1144522 RepID=A0A1J4KY63_9EUKA|nr:hypothetical protein TRFO_13346 [Tritrichomonas foetus]|eukprot:OHT16193.1 hypothetical protein TRFO_13346 [Tritrichomonas foetus]
MFSFFLFRFISSNWINFTPENYYVYMEEESKLSPIVALFTNSSNDQNLIDKFQHHSKNFNNINFTHIDCLKMDFCSTKVEIKVFPSIFLMQGQNFHYWREISLDGWKEQIKYDMIFNKNSVINLAESSTPLSTLIENVKNGGSVFHLDIAKEFQAVFIKFSQLVKYYNIFNTTSIYSIKKDNRFATLTSYYSTNCFTIRRIRPIEIDKFLDENKFSFYHRYFPNELKEVLLYSPFALIVTQNRSVLAEPYFAFNSQCHKIKFGMIDFITNKDFIKEFELENEKAPFIVGINIFKDCYSIFPIDADDTFYSNILNGQKCNRIGRKYGIYPMKSQSPLSMSTFALSFASVFAIFYCIASTKNSKDTSMPELKKKYD